LKKQITYQFRQHYNESGKVESIAFDFKGNLLSKQQAVISSTVLKTTLDGRISDHLLFSLPFHYQTITFLKSQKAPLKVGFFSMVNVG
jgi:hypothetical protein